MTLEKTRAAINLHAILRDMEDLCALDADAKALLSGHEANISFHVPGLEPLTLSVKDGGLTASRGARGGGLRLGFLSPRHFNAMVAGTKMPLPLGGFQQLKFLKNNFAALAKDLEKYLKPDNDSLKDPVFLERNTRLTAAAAMYAASEIANSDPLGGQIARAMGEGAVLVEVPGGPAYTIRAEGGKLATLPGEQPPVHAWMRFSSLAVLGQVLRGELDSYLAIGRGDIAVFGRIPLADNLNKLLGLVSHYLKA